MLWLKLVRMVWVESRAGQRLRDKLGFQRAMALALALQVCYNSFLHLLPRTHATYTHLPAQVLGLGPGLGAKVRVTDLLLYQVFQPVMHL